MYDAITIWVPRGSAEDTHYLPIVVGKIRNKLHDDHARARYLETEAGVGYRFRGEIGAGAAPR